MDYFFQEQRWTDTFLSLHVKKFKRIILFLLIAFSAAGTKAQSDVKFNDGVRYSQWVIDSRLGDFYGNTNDFGFTTYNRDLTVKKNVTKWKNGSTNPYIDYVPGLVAKATIEAAEYYQNFDWSKPWFKSVEWYGNKCTVPTSPDNLDAINASKMYFGIYNLANSTNGAFKDKAEDGTVKKATDQLGNALTALKYYNNHYAFAANTKLNGIDIAGGWYHKSTYPNQMWLDGQYMGPALLAQLINGYSSYASNKVSDNDWDLIAKQFTIVWNQCWDDTEKLLYHAFSSEALSYWTSDAEIWTTAQADKTKWTGMSAPGHSSAFWGRAEGWYFLALVDVLEQMPTTNANYSTLKNYLTTLADGIKARQDAKSGCWYQLVGKDGSYTASYYNGNSANPKTNYLESSCTAIFAAAYLKAVRLGLLSNDYKTIGENAYKGAVAQFMKQRTDGTVDLLGCCKSAGVGTDALGEAKFRDGSNAYYLHGYDVAPTSTTSNYYTEGKVLGAFIMAATEYEIANEKAIRFSYDLAPSYTLAQGDFIKAEALGSGAGTATYQWYKTTDGTTGTAVTGATTATFSPTESGSYYCEAKSGSTTIKTSPTVVTVSETVTPSESTNPVVWTFTTSTLTLGTLGTENNVVEFTSTDASSTVMTYVSGNGDAIESNSQTIGDESYSSYLKENGVGSVNGKRRMEFNAPSSKGTVTIVYAKTAGSTTIVDGSDNNKVLASLTQDDGVKIYTAVTTGVLTTTVDNKIIIYCPRKSYIYSVIWTPINETSGGETYTVTLNATGVTGYPQTKTYSGAALTLPTPVKTGYTFDGWYTAETGGKKVDNPYTPTADNTTLYAKWTPITDLFTLTGVTSTTVSVNSKNTVAVKSDYATITGGSAQLYNGHSDPKDMISSNQINLNGSSASYLKITLDNSLKAGDEITITPSTSSFNLSATNSTTDARSFTGSYVIQQGDNALVGKNEIYLYKGSNSLIGDINITRDYPESDSRATFTYGSSQLTFTETTEGTYTTTLEIGASKKGETITITPTAQDGATIKQNGTTVSGDITITAPSKTGNTESHTYTVNSKDGSSTTTYTINVTVVKEKITLKYSDKDGNTEWTWNSTTTPTQPTFVQPTVKAYIKNAEGKDELLTDASLSYTYESDVTSVATVDASSGKITIAESGNGGAKIYATLKKNENYYADPAFFNVLLEQGYSFSVNASETAPAINTSKYITRTTEGTEEKLVKMTFGGWKWEGYANKDATEKTLGSYKVVRGDKTRYYTDKWNDSGGKASDIASIDGHYYSWNGVNDAVDESKAASDKAIYGSIRYGWFKSPVHDNDGKTTESYPYTLPVRGSFMTFEPTMNGTLTIYILQNGAWNTNDNGGTYVQGDDGSITYEKGDIIPGQFRPHAFQVVNQRGLTVQEFSPNYSVSTKQKVDSRYYCMFQGDKDYNQTKYNNPYNVAKWTEFADYMSTEEQQRAHDSWNSGPLGAQKIIELDNGSFLAVQKGIVKYTFHVTGNETYYFFSNFSKMGFSGANFVPDVSQPQETVSDKISTLDLSDVTAYNKITATETGKNIEGTDLKEYTYKIGETEIAPVAGVTIPQFYSIKLKRTFKPNQWTTLSLPFNLTQTEVEQIFGKGTQIIVFDKAKITSARTYLTFFYHEIQNVLPGYPYLIRPTLVDANDNQMETKSNSADNTPTYTITGGNLTEFTVYNKAINPFIEQHEFKSGGYTAKCTPSYCTANENGNYSKLYKEGDIFVSEGKGTVYISEGQSYGKGYRSYIDYTGTTPPSAKALSISFSGVEDGDDNGTTTDIRVTELADDVIQTLGIGGVYNLNGQKVADTTRNLPAGIYIVNGRKVVVK